MKVRVRRASDSMSYIPGSWRIPPTDKVPCTLVNDDDIDWYAEIEDVWKFVDELREKIIIYPRHTNPDNLFSIVIYDDFIE
jgi:hypothetical protein